MYESSVTTVALGDNGAPSGPANLTPFFSDPSGRSCLSPPADGRRFLDSSIVVGTDGIWNASSGSSESFTPGVATVLQVPLWVESCRAGGGGGGSWAACASDLGDEGASGREGNVDGGDAAVPDVDAAGSSPSVPTSSSPAAVKGKIGHGSCSALYMPHSRGPGVGVRPSFSAFAMSAAFHLAYCCFCSSYHDMG